MPSSVVEYQDLADLLLTAKGSSVVVKPWGSEIVIELNNALLKWIRVQAGSRTSLQYHERKREVIYVLAAGPSSAGVHVQDSDDPALVQVYSADEAVAIDPGRVHRSVGPCTLLEITTKDNEDVVRVEDDYGREGL
jgi:mannose-6-phosphate isomerase-like protein (cupin superfamily)